MERHDEKSPMGQRVQGNWKQLKGKLKEKWGQLTDDELDRVEGRRDQLIGKIQERTGRQRMEIERDLDTLNRDVGYRFR